MACGYHGKFNKRLKHGVFDYGCLAGTENIAQTYESVAIKNDEALIILHRPMKALQC